MGKHAFWMASFQCLAKSLLPLKLIVHDTCIPPPSQFLFPYFRLFTSTNPITRTLDSLTFLISLEAWSYQEYLIITVFDTKTYLHFSI